MNIGDPDIMVADHATLGPVQIAIHQPKPGPSQEELLSLILAELRHNTAVVELMYEYMTRKRWWHKLLRWVKRYVAISR